MTSMAFAMYTAQRNKKISAYPWVVALHPFSPGQVVLRKLLPRDFPFDSRLNITLSTQPGKM